MDAELKNLIDRAGRVRDVVLIDALVALESARFSTPSSEEEKT